MGTESKKGADMIITGRFITGALRVSTPTRRKSRCSRPACAEGGSCLRRYPRGRDEWLQTLGIRTAAR